VILRSVHPKGLAGIPIIAVFLFLTNRAENGLVDFYRFLYGVEDIYRKNKLKRLISVTGADIAAAFASLGSRPLTGGPIVIAGIKKAEEAAKALGTEVQLLPV
jgi:Zn-dependent M16 (insulinase) family peptidase